MFQRYEFVGSVWGIDVNTLSWTHELGLILMRLLDVF